MFVLLYNSWKKKKKNFIPSPGSQAFFLLFHPNACWFKEYVYEGHTELIHKSRQR